jgi:hypothetical protein
MLKIGSIYFIDHAFLIVLYIIMHGYIPVKKSMTRVRVGVRIRLRLG